MSSTLRRYEVLLPVQFNDGSAIPDELLGEAVEEIVDKFGAVSFERDAVEGQWRSGAAVYRDSLSRIIVDVPDHASNRKWMRAFKANWKRRLDQLELWVISYVIERE